MNKVIEIEKSVKELSKKELKTFRDWFLKFDAEVWDNKIESDINGNKLDSLAKKINPFLQAVEKIRSKNSTISFEEITKEVEAVRVKRYER